MHIYCLVAGGGGALWWRCHMESGLADSHVRSCVVVGFLCFGFWNSRHTKMNWNTKLHFGITKLHETGGYLQFDPPSPPEIQQPSSTCSTRNSTDKLEGSGDVHKECYLSL